MSRTILQFLPDKPLFQQARAWIKQLISWSLSSLDFLLQSFYAIVFFLSLESVFFPLSLAILKFVHLNSDRFDNTQQLICAFSINSFQNEREKSYIFFLVANNTLPLSKPPSQYQVILVTDN